MCLLPLSWSEDNVDDYRAAIMFDKDDKSDAIPSNLQVEDSSRETTADDLEEKA